MSIRELTPEQARARQLAGAVVIDVRQVHERAGGMAEGARGVAMGELLVDPFTSLPSLEQEIVLICQSGRRSADAATALLAAGYTRLASVLGGTAAWRAAGLPLVRPGADTAECDFHDRYSRHLLLPQVGEAGQRRLQRSRVLVVGAGGLGAPAAFYLAAAGVGRLRIVDDDVVERSNLHRQIIHVDAATGCAKVDSARERLLALNPHIEVEAIQERVTSGNVDALMDGVDVVLDGSDNFPLRYLLNDACIKHARPLVYAAIERFDGQVCVFDAGRRRGQAPCYRCLFPEPPPPEFAPNCAEAGVLGVLPGLAGVMQATEVLKLLLDMGEPLAGRLLRFDALGMRFRETRVHPDPDCPLCAPGRAFPGYIDYAAFCAHRR
ncbi:MAG: molybdopterin-synthase adenylyltransferase MoeB [Stenotrophomonas nitritireducens]|uniref:molybdopterin-synthase adenylyltransferase MoeB n=1 Tax=Stenotrophomonas nitritireducens TaxID=83617 RepID=UPI001AD28C20|nr:molybdopterin-synthase adenylyltransferase MoeB [Stenotrophomonas nitritireducens]MBN8768766.1 molybdopterin-synthase adenylyltransferase MoeB [Stenotrophomonas sp.]MBN8792035.1 molybdopterin-synthase adenylyltransferase MoeB [Stenotrophomonas nitritireducens]